MPYHKDSPVTVVRMFQHQLESFFHDYKIDMQNPLGEVSDHVIKIEFQARGLYMHIVYCG